jgi:polar amino acid transport system substrate-binding protein
MKWITSILLSIWITSAFADDEIKVGISLFHPPFIMKAANNVYYGFDLSLIEAICTRLKKSCLFKSYPMTKLFQAVRDNKVDVAISGLTITLRRTEKFSNFTHPYMKSYAHFITNTAFAKKFKAYHQLEGKTIGVVKGSVYEQATQLMPLPKDVTLSSYARESHMVSAVGEGDIDLALLDAPTAHYWKIHSSGKIKIIGKLLIVGNGLGIAVNKQKPLLLEQINKELRTFMQSAEYKELNKKYFSFSNTTDKDIRK